jgi:N-acetylglucosaminyldiphosphoundecaprenol N-acetyl-beta-D-mannosaminyltransferase
MKSPEADPPSPRGGRKVLFGIGIDDLDLAGAMDALEALIAIGRPSLVVTPNVQHIGLLSGDREFRSAYEGASLVVADGVPIVWTSILLGRRLRARVAGSDLLPAFCPRAARKGYRLFFLGAGPGIAARASELLALKNPGLLVCGTSSPPFGFEHDAAENGRVIDLIRQHRPDALFIGLGTPKSEKWAWRHLEALGVPVVLSVGAAFDFIAGKKKRAPRWMQASGLEWFHRLIREPGRLWKRYLISNARFGVLVGKEIIRRKRP